MAEITKVERPFSDGERDMVNTNQSKVEDVDSKTSGSGEEKKRIRVKFDENIYTVINWYFLTVQ